METIGPCAVGPPRESLTTGPDRLSELVSRGRSAHNPLEGFDFQATPEQNRVGVLCRRLSARDRERAEERRERPRLAPAKADPFVSAGSLTPQVSVSVAERAQLHVASMSWPRMVTGRRTDRAEGIGQCVALVFPSVVESANAPTGIVRERRRASRLPSVPSALRGLDPRRALPVLRATIGASAEAATVTDLAGVLATGRRRARRRNRPPRRRASGRPPRGPPSADRPHEHQRNAPSGCLRPPA